MHKTGRWARLVELDRWQTHAKDGAILAQVTFRLGVSAQTAMPAAQETLAMGDPLPRHTLRNGAETDDVGTEVGHGKPPVHTRFQPGHSGNPPGRPKGANAAAKHLPER